MQTLGQTASPAPNAKGPELHPRLYLLFECDRLPASSLSISLRGLGELDIGRGSERSISPSRSELRLPDRWLSSKHARLTDSFGRWILQDEDSKNGCKVNGESVKRRELQDGDLLELGRSFFVFHSAVDDGSVPVINLETPIGFAPISLSPALSDEIANVEKLAVTDISILILGESGSGKEVLAQRIHRQSRRDGLLVPVNCGALPAGLVESELFGHRKGAFSGAVDDHKGLIRSADRGTLFLDEIADLPALAQATLLRVLQEKEVRPVGATTSHKVDLRTVSATHLDLDARVESGDFRRDLFARIAGYRMRMTPLRERREDMGLLMAAFFREKPDCNASLSIQAARALLAYSWPLNVRELRSCLATACVLSEGKRIELAHLPEAVRCVIDSENSTIGSSTPRSDSDQEIEAELVIALQEHCGNVSAVARAMSKDRKQIQRWIKRFELDLQSFRES